MGISEVTPTIVAASHSGVRQTQNKHSDKAKHTYNDTFGKLSYKKASESFVGSFKNMIYTPVCLVTEIGFLETCYVRSELVFSEKKIQCENNGYHCVCYHGYRRTYKGN